MKGFLFPGGAGRSIGTALLEATRRGFQFL